jgi:RNA polymerase sigma-70 factor (ECF subfamily)
MATAPTYKQPFVFLSERNMRSSNFSSRQGLPEVIDSLVKAHRTTWVRYVRRVLGNTADAEDAVQEAVRRVLSLNRPFSSKEDLRLYLGRAVSNTAIEVYHARRRDRMRLVPIKESAVAGPGGNPYDALMRSEEDKQRARLMGILSDALHRLPSKQYEALRLTLLEPDGVSIRDAGILNGIPYSTLRHRSVQGVRRLRKYASRAMRKGRQ